MEMTAAEARAEGHFSVDLRLYWPKAKALEGKWIALPMKRLK